MEERKSVPYDNMNFTGSVKKGKSGVRFAVVAMGNHAPSELFNLLISNGYSNVTFLNDLSEHPEEIMKKNGLVQPKKEDDPILTTGSASSSSVSLASSSPINIPPRQRRRPLEKDVLLPNLDQVLTSLAGTLAPSLVPPPAKRLSVETELRQRTPINKNSILSDESLYVICQLCDNKIMSSRLSNLTNHVRRHASIKQFQCKYCTYQHNEQAKVRLHMTHNHKDSVTQPKDNITVEMQKTWDLLMEQCFPGFMEQARANPNMTLSERERMQQRQKASIPSYNVALGLIPEVMHNCIECGDPVTIAELFPVMEQNNPFSDHLRDKHLEECVAYKCDECDYVNAEQWKVRWHISVRHAEKAADVTVSQMPAGDNLKLFILKYFPSATTSGIVVDHEEEKLMADLKGSRQSPDMDQPSHSASSSPRDEGLTLMEKLVGATATAVTTKSSRSKILETIDLSQPLITKDPTPTEEDRINCKLCNKVLDFENQGALYSLMSHAKRHYHIKQFECTQCSYASSEAAHVRTHLLVKHNSHDRPMDHNNEHMQSAWLQVMRRCFPGLKERISQFRFKSGRCINGGDVVTEVTEYQSSNEALLNLIQVQAAE